ERPVLLPAAACDYTTGYLAALGVTAALWRRAREGGSYHVRASLTQTGMWMQRDGSLHDPATAPGVGDGAQWMSTTDSPWGTVQHLRPAVDMTDTPPAWQRATVPLGFDPPAWPSRPAPSNR